MWATGILAVFAILQLWALPALLKSVLTDRLAVELQRPVEIREVRLYPLALSLRVFGLSVKDRGGAGPFVSFEELYLNIEAASLFKGGPVLRDVVLEGLRLSLTRNNDLSYNLSDLLQKFSAKPAAPDTEPARYSLNNIQLVNGRIDFDDRPKQTRHAVTNINISVPFLSNLPYDVDIYVKPGLSALVNGAPLELKGKTRPFTSSRETVVDLDFTRFDVAHYLPYLPTDLNYRVTSGIVDTRMALSFVERKDLAPLVTLTGRAVGTDIAVTDLKAQPLLSAARLELALAQADPIAKRYSLNSLVIQTPRVHAHRNHAGNFNLEALIPEDDGSPPALFNAASIQIKEGEVSYADDTQKEPFRTTLKVINGVARHFSNAPGKESVWDLRLATESDETLHHVGRISLKPFTAEGTLDLTGVRINKYAPYYRDALRFDIKDGMIDAASRYAITPGPDGYHINFDGLAGTLHSLRLHKTGEDRDFLQLPELAITETNIDIKKRSLVIGKLTTRDARIEVMRNHGGEFNWSQLVAPSPSAEQSAPPSPSWSVLLKKLSLQGYGVRFADQAVTQPVVVNAKPISINAENLSTEPKVRSHATLALTLNNTGKLALRGALALKPLSADLNLDAKGIAVVPFQPYFTDKVNLVITRGTVAAKGRLSLVTTPDKAMTTGFKGNINVSRLAALDKLNLDDLLRWDSLYISGIDVGINPFHLAIKEIALSDFYSRLEINPEGIVNLQQIVVEAPSGENTVPPARVAPPTALAQRPVTIDKVTLQGGEIDFHDRFIKPHYFANMTEMTGRVSGLSSDPQQRADIDLKGKLENHAPLEVTGKINPLSHNLYADLKIDFKDFDLSPLTPYSGKYVGYTIQKGKLALNLKYLIDQRKLESQNKVFLDQLTFGDPVDSPDAIHMPVTLAVALLQNRKGEIDLDLPVTGTLDDPEFRLGPVIFKIIKNIIVKVVTAPFALIGSLFGGGEELSYLEFDYGSAGLSAGAQTKLQSLAKALYERPALNLEITGHADPVQDKEGMRQNEFQRKLKVQKLNDMLKRGEPAMGVDEIKIESAEYPKYLKRAYENEKFPKPRNILGFAKDLPVPEMEKLMLTHIEITTDDLRHLVMERAQNVADHLLRSGQVVPQQIFLVEPKSLAPEAKEKLKNSRVDFAIK